MGNEVKLDSERSVRRELFFRMVSKFANDVSMTPASRAFSKIYSSRIAGGTLVNLCEIACQHTYGSSAKANWNAAVLYGFAAVLLSSIIRLVKHHLCYR